MRVQNRTILAGLEQERDRILEALKPVDTKTLQAQLTTIEHAIAIYQPRVTESVKDRLPATLKAAKKIRSESSSNGNSNGKIRNAAGRLVNPHSDHQQQKLRIIAVLSDPNNGDRKAMAPYINSGYLTRNAKGEYLITAKGKARLQELTDASTP